MLSPFSHHCTQPGVRCVAVAVAYLLLVPFLCYPPFLWPCLCLQDILCVGRNFRGVCSSRKGTKGGAPVLQVSPPAPSSPPPQSWRTAVDGPQHDCIPFIPRVLLWRCTASRAPNPTPVHFGLLRGTSSCGVPGTCRDPFPCVPVCAAQRMVPVAPCLCSCAPRWALPGRPPPCYPGACYPGARGAPRHPSPPPFPCHDSHMHHVESLSCACCFACWLAGRVLDVAEVPPLQRVLGGWGQAPRQDVQDVRRRD